MCYQLIFIPDKVNASINIIFEDLELLILIQNASYVFLNHWFFLLKKLKYFFHWFLNCCQHSFDVYMLKLHMPPLSQGLQFLNTVNQPSSSLFKWYREIIQVVKEFETLLGQVGHNLRIANCLKHKLTKQLFCFK